VCTGDYHGTVLEYEINDACVCELEYMTIMQEKSNISVFMYSVPVHTNYGYILV